jgi:hypothetical protein
MASIKTWGRIADAVVMDACPHGMETPWCYLCRIDASGADSQTAWGLDAFDAPDVPDDEGRMTDDQSGHLRFLCQEFGASFHPSLNQEQAALEIANLIARPMPESQAKTLAWLSERQATPLDPTLTYGQARTAIRKLIALKGLKSA